GGTWEEREGGREGGRAGRRAVWRLASREQGRSRNRLARWQTAGAAQCAPRAGSSRGAWRRTKARAAIAALGAARAADQNSWPPSAVRLRPRRARRERAG